MNFPLMYYFIFVDVVATWETLKHSGADAKRITTGLENLCIGAHVK